MKIPKLRPIALARNRDLATRRQMRVAHLLGRHGPWDGPLDVVAHWAPMCAGCNVRYRHRLAGAEA